MKYIYVDLDDGSLRTQDEPDPKFYPGCALFMELKVPDDFVLQIPLDKLSDPYIYEYLQNHPDVEVTEDPDPHPKGYILR